MTMETRVHIPLRANRGFVVWPLGFIRRTWVAALLVFAVTACKDLTNVSNPDVIQTSQLNNPAGALTLRAGAVSYFATYFGQAVFQSGLLTDELMDVSGGNYKGDQRVITSVQNAYSYPFVGLSQARVNGMIATQAMQRYDSTSYAQIGELFAYRAYIEIVIAETMCSGVPLATLVNGQPTSAPVYSTRAMIRDALALLDTASTYAAGDDSLTNLVLVGRGRALLDTGNLAGAASAVAPVPVAFAYTPPYDGINQINGVFEGVVNTLSASVSNIEGINGLDFRSANDPRVPTQGIGVSPTTGDSVYNFLVYSSGASPIVLASGIEGRLIAAESLLPVNGGSGNAWLAALNVLRTDGTYIVSSGNDTTYNAGEGGIAGLAPLVDPGSDTARVSLLFRERAFWMFASGHRQGDLRRLVWKYQFSEQNVFPIGLYEGGPAQYGNDVSFVPIGEQYNPLYHSCDPTAP
jgi:starch-binding outer membrane protein, SusD/RagB family